MGSLTRLLPTVPPTSAAGSATTVIVPQAGFLLPHVWRPLQRCAVTVSHDMTIREGDGVGPKSAADDNGTAGRRGRRIIAAPASVTANDPFDSAAAASKAVISKLSAHTAKLDLHHWGSATAAAVAVTDGQFPSTGVLPVALLQHSSRVVYVNIPEFSDGTLPWQPGCSDTDALFNA